MTRGAFHGIIVIASAGLLALAVQVALFKPFHVTSGSMEPTLLVGDRFLVTKFAYGYSRDSFSFLPLRFSGRVLAAPPRRGDVVVFRYSKDDGVDYVKRIIGLPGERIQLVADVLHIDGAPVPREELAPAADGDGRAPTRRWRETLPNGVSYVTQELPWRHRVETSEVFVVPDGQYFIIGDNRDNSRDSRDLSDIGYVPFDHLVGRAGVIFHSMAKGVPFWQVWRWPEAARFERTLTFVE